MRFGFDIREITINNLYHRSSETGKQVQFFMFRNMCECQLICFFFFFSALFYHKKYL